jgi:hypothetical protein
LGTTREFTVIERQKCTASRRRGQMQGLWKLKQNRFRQKQLGFIPEEAQGKGRLPRVILRIVAHQDIGIDRLHNDCAAPLAMASSISSSETVDPV